MRLTENLKEKLGEAKTEEEVRKILQETKKNVEESGILLDDDELNMASGGKFLGLASGSIYK